MSEKNSQYIEDYNGPIFLDTLRCRGDEKSLLDCSFGEPVGFPECTPDELVAVHCDGM